MASARDVAQPLRVGFHLYPHTFKPWHISCTGRPERRPDRL